jgi:RNA polymerase sigma-70 factor, ECF subfamily
MSNQAGRPSSTRREQDRQYQDAVAQFGPALNRLGRAYEADASLIDDLLQEIHFAIWRSFASYDGRCSVRTWVFRVAHNTAASHVLKRTRLSRKVLVTLDEVEPVLDPHPIGVEVVARRQALDRVFALIHQLDPFDRQIMVAYLEEMDAAAIGELTGLSPGAVATKIYRVKTLLARRFQLEPGA